MTVFDISSSMTLLLMLIATGLLIFLSQELKKSYIVAIPLFFYLVLLIIHVVQLVTLPGEYSYMIQTLSYCLAIDFIFILVSFFAYLWVDDLEAKKLGKKSIDNSLDWFWKNV